MSVPLAVIARRHGVVIRLIDPEGDAGGPRGGGRPRSAGPARAWWPCHMCRGPPGRCSTWQGAARAARAVGALVLVDGAQSVGAIPVDVGALDIDAYAFPAHKWLLGPEGLGALWVSPRGARSHRPDGVGLRERHRPRAGRRRGGRIPGRAVTRCPRCRRRCCPRGARPSNGSRSWGGAWIHDGVATAQAAAWAGLSAVPGVRVLTPAGPSGRSGHLRRPGAEPGAGLREAGRARRRGALADAPARAEGVVGVLHGRRATSHVWWRAVTAIGGDC